MWLAGEDREHLATVGEAAWEEVQRVEKMLSRFDPSAEVARVNREAVAGPVLVDYELFAILEDCRQWFYETGGFFDIGATSGVPYLANALLNVGRRTVEFLDERLQLDFGAMGKGYALDAAARILDQFAVAGALLHGGTSSVLAIGVREDGSPWPVGVRDPFREETREIRRLSLANQGMSTSASRTPNAEASDLVDPVAGAPFTGQVACVVVAPTAMEAEVLSTAFLAMGKSRACKFLERRTPFDLHQVLWIEPHENAAKIAEIFPP